jgi:competence ComEA-like helix-hairpin-helix protein
VHLRGDFVMDVEGRAIDAEFVRAELPTGDRPKGVEFGIQGGHFESWLRIAPEQIRPSEVRLSLNRATPEELAQLPGVDERIARQIVARRQRAPFTRVEDLTQIRGLTAEFVEVIRDLVTTD